jgi:hypothetical protein
MVTEEKLDQISARPEHPLQKLLRKLGQEMEALKA